MTAKTFYPFYEEKISKIINRIQKKVLPMDMLADSVWPDLDTVLYEVMHKAVVRTLICEMHTCLEKGIIVRSDPKKEYLSYMELLSRMEYRKDILNRYAGLSKLLEITERNQYEFWMEFFFSLKKDWKLINRLISGKGKEVLVKGIKASGSDPHLRGRMVIQIITDNGSSFFYKPHGMANETFLRDLINKICKEYSWKNYRQKILDRNTYGWVEEIPYRSCGSKEEVTLFYQKSGMLAAISYILGIGDMHYENIITDKENPVIIDAETLFQNMRLAYGQDEKMLVFYSALTSGLFPGGTVGKNLSGIMGGEECLYNNVVPVILNDRTSEMRVGYKRPRLRKGKNKVRYGNEDPDISQYINDIIHGFHITYQWFLHNRDEVMEMIIDRESGLYSRYISGATQFFALGLSASTHPQLLIDFDERVNYLKKITDGRGLNAWETEAMLEGDIPWFCRYINDCNLYSGHEIIKKNFFEHTLLEELEQCFKQLTYEDNILQQKALRLSVNIFADEKKWTNDAGIRVRKINISDSVTKRWGKERFLLSAKKIADKITSNAIRYGDKIFWFSVTNVGEQLVIKPVDYYFYSGIAGIAVFFRKLCIVCPEYVEISSILEHMLFSYTEKVSKKEIMPDTQYTGMYCGESSIAYAYQLLYQITDNGEYLLYAGKHLKALSEYVESDSKFDLLYGNAGIILILCQQYLYTGDLYYRNEACKTLEILERNCRESEAGAVWYGGGNENSVCSIAHGNSGVLLAYARLNSILPGPDYIKRMKQIISYENQFYDKQTGNWADLRKIGEDTCNTYAWCNGGLGVLYARMQAARWNPKELWLEEEVEKIVPLCRNMRVRDGMCLCHGNIGNLIILEKISRYMNRAEINDAIRNLYRYILSELEKDLTPQMPQERYNMGVMNGLAGVGLGFIDWLSE